MSSTRMTIEPTRRSDMTDSLGRSGCRCRGQGRRRRRRMASMPRLQRKSFTTPDQVRTFSNGRIDIVNLDETTIGRFVWEPGWRWSKDVKPVVQTETCQNRHVGYVISGNL